MTIKPIFINIDNKNTLSFKKKEYKSYLEAEGAVDTQNNVKPLPGKGHLIHDTFANKVKYFFKDIAYDMKSVKNGFNGTANDHQSGRLNDVGLKLGGIGIATYLASKTSDPRTRLMEYVGLGAFLAAMNLYPKIAINKPAKLVHGFDIDKQYIDDQGRKKSVYQDSNYIPYDLYRGEAKGENFSEIGDVMGIPRDIEDRDELIKEQTRKIATQNNTLWMLTACVTPAMTALICKALESPLGYAIDKGKNLSYNTRIANLLTKTEGMAVDVASVTESSLSKNVAKLLEEAKGKVLSKEALNKLTGMLTEGLDSTTTEGVKADLAKMFEEAIPCNGELVDDILSSAKKSIKGRNIDVVEKALLPSKAEVEAIVKSVSGVSDLTKEARINGDKLAQIKTEIKRLIDSKIEQATNIPKEHLELQRNNILEGITKGVNAKKASFVSEESIKLTTDFAKVINEFKANQVALDKCKNFKVETILGRYYNKFQETFLKELNISFKDLRKMRESEEFTKEILDKKLAELCKDEAKYKKTLDKLTKIISEMEVDLNGKSETQSHIKNLIRGIENNYNKTAERLGKLSAEKYSNTISMLVKGNLDNLNLSSKEELFNYLDGIKGNELEELARRGWDKMSPEEQLRYLKYNADGIGSSKSLQLTRLTDRYQGAKNSLHRAMHTLDIYKRAINPEEFGKNITSKDSEYLNAIIKKAKETMLNATSSDHTLKLGTINNPQYYKDLVNTMWNVEAGSTAKTKQKGIIDKATKEAIGNGNSIANGNVLERFQTYISRFRNVITNNTIDFTKPEHILDPSARVNYAKGEKTRMAMFNLIGQSPVDMIKNTADRKFVTGKWIRIMSAVTAGIFSIAVLAQFAFGKIRNPHNIKKQVNNDTNK